MNKLKLKEFETFYKQFTIRDYRMNRKFRDVENLVNS
jgi:hypothetical protein